MNVTRTKYQMYLTNMCTINHWNLFLFMRVRVHRPFPFLKWLEKNVYPSISVLLNISIYLLHHSCKSVDILTLWLPSDWLDPSKQDNQADCLYTHREGRRGRKERNREREREIKPKNWKIKAETESFLTLTLMWTSQYNHSKISRAKQDFHSNVISENFQSPLSYLITGNQRIHLGTQLGNSAGVQQPRTT